MLIPHVPEKPHLALFREQRHREGVDWCISVSFVVEAAVHVEVLKVGFWPCRAKKVQRAYLEIGEELAVVVVAGGGGQEPVQLCGGVDEVCVGRNELNCRAPKGREGAGVVEDGHVEAVDQAVVAQEAEWVVIDVAEEMDLRVLVFKCRACNGSG